MSSFNKDLLNENFGDDKEILEELVALFIQEAPGMIAPIKSAIDANESSDLRLYAHTFKGAVSNFFAEKCVEYSLELEMMGKNGTIDSDRAKELVSSLEAELEVLSKDLKEFVS